MGRRKKYNTDEERKAAKREAQKRWREEHKDEIAAYNTTYKAAHKDEIAEYMTAYNAAHKEEYAAYNAAHKEEKAAYNAEYRSTPFGRAKYLVCGYHKKDKKYNRGECTIDAQWIVDNVFNGQCCHYCGESDWNKLGVDRKDSSLAHTPENCVPCCKACNDKKNTTPYDDFMRMIGKVI